MAAKLSIAELPPPRLQFGGASATTDPKVGLLQAGPFDLRFGSARGSRIHVGIIGVPAQVEGTRRWLERTESGLLAVGDSSLLNRPFPGFSEIFRKELVVPDVSIVELDDGQTGTLSRALEMASYAGFQSVVDAYDEGLRRLAARDVNRPDIVLICIPDAIYNKLRAVERAATEAEVNTVKAFRQANKAVQLDLFAVMDEVEQTADDLLKRDLRLAIKARALKHRIPIQLVRSALIEDGLRTQDPATKAWNVSVGIYYKSGGVPWRLPPQGPDTCFVGVSFHHFRTTRRAMVRSSLAQAFSSDGEGFAIRGEGVPVESNQGRNVHLTEAQAYTLATGIVAEYTRRTGRPPLRVVLHKTSFFDQAELAGLQAALSNIPLVSMVTLVPSAFRLLRYGMYPPKVGTVARVNDARAFLFTSGFMPELGTYPGPHVPQPFEVRCLGADEPLMAAQDVLNLTRMNWNTADIRGKWPVSLSFARRVGGILDEFGDDELIESSFRYFV